MLSWFAHESDKLEDHHRRYHFEPQSVYNVDETGLTTVQNPCKVVAHKEIKQIGSINRVWYQPFQQYDCIVMLFVRSEVADCLKDKQIDKNVISPVNQIYI